MSKLYLPSLGLVDSYRDYLQEFEEAGEELYPFTTEYSHSDPRAFIRRLAAESEGRGLPQGYVAHTTYWLTVDGVVVGVSNLRHELTPHLRHEGGHIGYGVRPSARGNGYATELLRLTLAQAYLKGITRALLICATTNEASIRTILANGGVLEAGGVEASDGTLMNRYWIESS